MNWFRKPPAPEPEPTPADYLAMADAALHEAESEFALAHHAVNGFYARHRDYLPITDIAGQVTITIKPPNAELAALLSRENRSIHLRNRAMQRRAELRKLYQPESQHVAGVRVR